MTDMPVNVDDLEEAVAMEPLPLSDRIYDAIVNSDCACKPGDPTCEDWTDSGHRWNAIHLAVMQILEQEDPEQEHSGLVAHARRELALIGTDQWFIDGMVDVVRAFAKTGHSGGSASVAIPTINDLLQFKNLSPLTNDPDDWVYHEPAVSGESNGLWQCRRNGEAFSNDGGKTYWLLSEGGTQVNRRPLHTSKPKQQ